MTSGTAGFPLSRTPAAAAEVFIPDGFHAVSLLKESFPASDAAPLKSDYSCPTGSFSDLSHFFVFLFPVIDFLCKGYFSPLFCTENFFSDLEPPPPPQQPGPFNGIGFFPSPVFSCQGLNQLLEPCPIDAPLRPSPFTLKLALFFFG